MTTQEAEPEAAAAPAPAEPAPQAGEREPEAEPKDGRKDAPKDPADGGTEEREAAEELGGAESLFAWMKSNPAAVINYFHGENAIAVAGVGGAASAPASIRQDDGQVGQEELDRQLRYYLPPAAFATAWERLIDTRFVILTGTAGSGRAAGSLALAMKLRTEKLADGGILRKPPTLTLGELAAKKYRKGEVHILHDWVPLAPSAENQAERQQSSSQFHAQKLVEVLREADAYLLVTADREVSGALVQHSIAWHAPDATELFEHCLKAMAKRDDFKADALTEDDRQRLREHARELTQPHRVLTLVEVAGTQDVDAALAAIGNQDSDAAASWLATKRTEPEQILAAAALVFAGGLTMLHFERLFERLVEIHTEDELPPATEAGGEAQPDLPAQREKFSRRRRMLLETESQGIAQFLTPRDRAPGRTGEHRPGFRTAAMRDAFLTELLDSCDHALWQLVARWLDEVTAVPFGEAHSAVAEAAARLAQFSPNQAYEHLDRWAGGSLGQRLTAAYAIWKMGGQDATAADALSWAVDWCEGRGPERAMTAAVALGGPLGRRYPSEGARWLWRLVLRGNRIRAVAQYAFANLFAEVAGSAEGPEILLGFLGAKLRQAQQPGIAPPERRAAFDAAVEILCRRDEETLVAVRILREHPAQTARLGRLWALVLQSRPHRGAAAEALRSTLAALGEQPADHAAARRLGGVVLPRLNAGTRIATEAVLRAVPRPENSANAAGGARPGRPKRPAGPSRPDRTGSKSTDTPVAAILAAFLDAVGQGGAAAADDAPGSHAPSPPPGERTAPPSTVIGE